MIQTFPTLLPTTKDYVASGALGRALSRVLVVATALATALSPDIGIALGSTQVANAGDSAKPAPKTDSASATTSSLPAATKNLTMLGTIDTETSGKLTLINIRFNQDLPLKSLHAVQNHGAFLQLILPNVIVPEPGKFIDGNMPWIAKIGVFQLTASDAGIRFFVNGDAAKIKQAMSSEILGSRVILSLDHDKLRQMPLTSSPSSSPSSNTMTKATLNTHPEAPSSTPSGTSATIHPLPVHAGAASQAAVTGTVGDFMGPPVPNPGGADSIIANTEVKRDIPPPSDLLKADDQSANSTASKEKNKPLNLRQKLLDTSLFSGAVFALLALMSILRPWLRRRRASMGLASSKDTVAGSSPGMHTVASLNVAPRQRISLIQVGTAQFLIGVSPDTVTFLTAVSASPGAMTAPLPKPSLALPASQSTESIGPRQAFRKMLLGERGQSAASTGSAKRASLAGGDNTAYNDEPLVTTKPVLKNLPGNDEKSLRTPPASARRHPQASANRPQRPTASANPAKATPSTPVRQNPQTGERRIAAGAVPAPQRRVNIAVSDEGIHDLRPAATAKPRPNATAGAQGQHRSPEGASSGTQIGPTSKAASDDVTKMIREKLKQLRTI